MLLKFLSVTFMIMLFNPIALAMSLVQTPDKEIIDFEIPIASDAYYIHESLNKPPSTKAVYYKLKESYPAVNILGFYDKQFKSMDISPFNDDGYGDREWHRFYDSTRPGTPEIKQLIATWADNNKKIRILLILKYVSFKDKTNNEEVQVTCQVQPFSVLPSQ